MKKYIVVNIPKKDKNEDTLCWWVPKHVPEIIEILEKENPNYEFHQFVTSPCNGGYKEFAIMKINK